MSNIKTLNRKGRKPGATNLKTREKAAMQSEAVKLLASTLSDAEIKTMSPLDVLLACMQAAFASGDLDRARMCASEAAPYVHSRVTPIAPETAIPDDLAPDAPPAPDEPGPENPVL
nr:hypothetical protein [uncultured Rhodopila sp.]